MKTHKHALALAKQMEKADELALSRTDLDLAAKALRQLAAQVMRAKADRVTKRDR